MNIGDFDIISRVDGWIAQARFGAGVKITWSAGTQHDGAAVEQLLNGYGIRTYAYQFSHGDSEDYGLHVRSQQAEWAEHLMRRAGVPLTSPLVSPANAKVQPGPMPEKWGVPSKPVGLVGRVTTALYGGVKDAKSAVADEIRDSIGL